MSEADVQTNKDAVMALRAAYASRDRAKIEACFTEDARWIVPKDNATALAAGQPGVASLNRSEISRFIAHDFPRLFVAGIAMDFTGIYGEGDTVIVEQRLRATMVNGAAYDNLYCFIYKLRGGLICEMREYMDTLSGFRQIFGADAVKPVAPLIAPAHG